MAEQRMALARLPPLSNGKVATISPKTHRLEGLNGPTYRLNEKMHPLPPPNALKPYVDTKAGEMDTWPAHASGNALSQTTAMLSKNKSLVLVNEEDMGKPQMVPKPRFLDQLENFLKKELRALGVIDVHPSDLRLQAHREVFEYLIEDFKTYKPLLSAIKNEYEMMLAYQRQQIRQLEPLKQMLVTVSEQCEQKIMAIREDERGEMSDLKKENRNLYGRISSLMNEQQDLKEQVNRLQTKLGEEYHKYRDECDARKLLVADINDLRYQQEDYLASKNNAQNSADTEEDPVIVKAALVKSREAEKRATQKLNEMVANYGDVIPRRDFEGLEKKHKELEESLETSDQDFKKLQAEHNVLLGQFKELTEQRNKYYVELEGLKRSSTPRPDWEKAGECVQGGMARWREITEGKSSDEKVDVLLTEIQSGGIADTSGGDYFDGQGSEESVPVYLRHEGPVKNRKIGKRDTALLVRDIWKEKSASDAERTDGTRQKMSEFLHEYLQKRFSLGTMVTEWAYNLHDACQRYAQDDSIQLFWKVLNDEADEEIWHTQLLTIHSLMTAMMGEGEPETLTREQFQTALTSYFPALSDPSAMMRAVDLELGGTDIQDIDYKSLFTEDDEGKTGEFLNEVKKFVKEEKERYVDDIKEILKATNPISVDELTRAFAICDPEISQATMHAYTAWAFSTTVEGLKDANPLDSGVVIERLANGNIARVGKK